jgi:hypothetical protein
VLVPAAAASTQAKRVHRLRLSLVPLQTAQLGTAGASLPLQFDSGTVSNSGLPTQLKKAGRIGGYLLDYGSVFSGGDGVTSIGTQVEQFRTPAGAKRALRFWKKNDKLDAAAYHKAGIVAGARFFKMPAVGSGHFGYLTWWRIPDADPVYTVDEEATSGSFVLHATVSAGTESTAERLAPVLTARLVDRVRRLLDGHLHGTPAKLPPLPRPGPPTGGPDLSTLVVGAPDFTGPATVIQQGYDIDPTTLSEYAIDVRPAGPFDEVQQQVSWYANDNEGTWEGTLFDTIFGGNALAPVALGAVGDHAEAAIGSGKDQSGAQVSLALVSMWRGQALDFALAVSPTTIQPSAVQTLAQAMASRLDAGIGS